MHTSLGDDCDASSRIDLKAESKASFYLPAADPMLAARAEAPTADSGRLVVAARAMVEKLRVVGER